MRHLVLYSWNLKGTPFAVKEVIGTHYKRQVQDRNSRQKEPELVETLSKFRVEELEHRDIAVEHDEI